jgi:hypothetical protein
MHHGGGLLAGRASEGSRRPSASAST